jgi:hypothetical protein
MRDRKISELPHQVRYNSFLPKIDLSCSALTRIFLFSFRAFKQIHFKQAKIACLQFVVCSVHPTMKNCYSFFHDFKKWII